MIIVAFGGNLSSSNCEQATLFALARDRLIAAGCKLAGQSRLYSTPPLGAGRQARYVNAVAVFERGPPPRTLLRLLKEIERSQGRKYGYHWGPRVLDLDLIAHGACVHGWPVHKRRRNIVSLPHPEAHRRGFVLLPLIDAENSALALIGRPAVHPIFGQPFRALSKVFGIRLRDIIQIEPLPPWDRSTEPS